MAGYLIGVTCVALAIWRWRAERVPEDAIPIRGRVIEVVSRTSTQTGRTTKVHAPRVAYRHPRTGQDEVLEPSTFTQRSPDVGTDVDLVFDPTSGKIRLPPPDGLRMSLVLVALGIGFLFAGWAG